MPNEMLRFSDFLVENLGLSLLEVSNLRQAAPLLMTMPVVDATHGAKHEFLREIKAPVVGFRKEYKGRFFSKSEDEKVTIDLEAIDFSWAVDTLSAARYPVSRGGKAGLIEREGMRHLRAALFRHELQIVNGVVGATWSIYNGASDEALAGSTDGFLGFADAYDTVANGAVDFGGVDSDNAGGGITGLTSLYFVTLGEAEIAKIVNPQTPVQIGETTKQLVSGLVNDPDANAQGSDGGDNYSVYHTEGLIDAALQVSTAWSLRRVANVGGTGAGLAEIDDDIFYKIVSDLPANRRPTHVAMNPRAKEMLRRSRTATESTGTPAPVPTTVADGIPIITTDTISNNEVAVA